MYYMQYIYTVLYYAFVCFGSIMLNMLNLFWS